MRVELIAEVSSNHGGDRGLMEAFIAQYAEAGADFVKFQSYQVRTLRPGDPQRDWLAQAELSDEDHHFLIETCARYGTQFLTTVFHASRVPFLASLRLEAIKVGSGEAGNDRLRAAINNRCETWPRAFVSCGTLRSADSLPWFTCGEYLACCSRYPHPAAFAAAPTYRLRLRGYSDHSIGVDGPKLAIACGARLIEKHVSLPEQKRPRRAWEATVADFRELRQFADDDPLKYIGRWQAI